MEVFLQALVSGLAQGCVYALVAIGFVIIYKATEVPNFAQGETMMDGEIPWGSGTSPIPGPETSQGELGAKRGESGIGTGGTRQGSGRGRLTEEWEERACHPACATSLSPGRLM